MGAQTHTEKGNLDTTTFKRNLGKLFKIIFLVRIFVLFFIITVESNPAHNSALFKEPSKKAYVKNSNIDLVPKPACKHLFLEKV